LNGVSMIPTDVARLILNGHIINKNAIDDVPGIRLELQLNYSGLMARGAYRGWKRAKHVNRRKVGCFDFKIFDTNGRPLVHPRVIAEASSNLNREIVEKVFAGRDPFSMGLAPPRATVCQEVQLSMLEQEINWGDEVFQSWTFFPPSQEKRPRDFIMAYLRRIFEEPDFLPTTERKIAASGTRGVLPPPKTKAEWKDYLEPAHSTLRPWLDGRLLSEYRQAAERMADNPHYAEVYGIQP